MDMVNFFVKMGNFLKAFSRMIKKMALDYLNIPNKKGIIWDFGIMINIMDTVV